MQRPRDASKNDLDLSKAANATIHEHRLIYDGAIPREGKNTAEAGKTRELKRKHWGSYEKINRKSRVFMLGLIDKH